MAMSGGDGNSKLRPTFENSVGLSLGIEMRAMGLCQSIRRSGLVEVMAWLACGYFIPRGASQRWGVVRLWRSVSHVVRSEVGLDTCFVSSQWVSTPVQ